MKKANKYKHVVNFIVSNRRKLKEKDKKAKNKRKHIKKQELKYRKKIQGNIDHQQKIIGKKMIKEFDTIGLSCFQIQDMTKKVSPSGKRRVLNKGTTIDFLNLRHYKFRQHMLYLGERYKRNIHMVSEHYTSKNCQNCGFLNYKLGGNKTFKCPFCDFTIDRDKNGAFNIFLYNVHKICNKIEFHR